MPSRSSQTALVGPPSSYGGIFLVDKLLDWCYIIINSRANAKEGNMADICIFNSAYRDSERRWISVEDVNIVTQSMDWQNRPYILFEHADYPLGALRADFMDGNWYCDLD